MDTNPTAVAESVVDDESLEKKVKSGASWFFWIAALSLVNSVMAFSGSDHSFLVGLAVTQAVDGIAQVGIAEGGSAALAYVALAIDVVVFGVLIAVGAFSRKYLAVYVVGIVLYALDAALCGVLQIWGHLGFHALATFFLWRGLSALRQLSAAAAPALQARPNPLVR